MNIPGDNVLVQITDNKLASDWIRKNAAHLYDEMTLKGAIDDGVHTKVVLRTLWNPTEKQGAFIAYFGAGAKEDDNGWSISLFRAEDEPAFEEKVALFKGFYQSMSVK